MRAIDKYLTWITYTVIGRDMDAFYKEHKADIEKVALVLLKKYPPKRVMLYRGIILSEEESASEKLEPIEKIQYISFSDRAAIAKEFADIYSDLAFAIRGIGQKSKGFIIKYLPPLQEIVYHYSWAPIIGVNDACFKIMKEYPLNQNEIILKQKMKKFDLMPIEDFKD